MTESRLQRALVRPYALLRLTSDLHSYREYMSLREGEARDDGEVELRIGRLSGRSVWVRPGTGDVDQLWEVFIRHSHLPPARIQRRGIFRIWDLGAGIGLSMADLSVEFPDAKVVGVEPDRDAAALARRNFEPWDGQASLVEEPIEPQTLNALLQRGDGEPVHLVRMDVAGLEQELLTRDTEWAEQVWCMKVTVHGDYTREACVADLERLGFRARAERRHERIVLAER
jgi:hypothetical protein